MKKIALIIPSCDGEWLGGLNYYSNLVVQCQKWVSDRLEFTVITSPECEKKIREVFPDGTTVLATRLVKKSLPWLVRNLIYVGTGIDLAMQWFFKRHGIAIVSHSPCRNYGKDIQVFGWIPDCQHKHLPHFFSHDEITKKDRDLLRVLNCCDRLIVSSQVAYDDLQRFYQVPEGKLAILRFYKQPVFNPVTQTRKSSLDKYQLPENFFYLPNQFWAHKNHTIVINALKLLANEGLEATVVCSGNTHDYRNPNFFFELIQRVEHAGLGDRFRVIGLVPREDVHSLIKYSMAMINPSLFEGWSTSVEEARANGKRIILSDIPVHREQSPPDALFFQPDSANELAKKIRQVALDFSRQREEQRQRQAEASANQLSRQFAHEYAKIIESAS